MKHSYFLFLIVFLCILTFFLIAVFACFPKSEPSFSLENFPASVWVIDPGHGGEDGGAVSTDGTVVESQLNLEISIRLRDLADFLGVETVLLRDTDTALYTEGETLREKKRSDLNHRLEIIEGTSNALLISIHQNFFEQSQYSGAQSFYTLVGKSRACAESIQEKLRQAVDPQNDRVAKRIGEDVFLMNHVTCPAVLVECGFLSNTEECQRLQQEEVQKRIVIAIAAGILDSKIWEDV